MERITKELEHATGNKRDSLRQTRRIYSSFVRGDDILQDSEDEEEEHARQEAEAAAAEEDEAETAAAAAAREAEEEAARAADPDVRASQIAQWIRRRWERRVKYPQSSIDGVTMFPRPPPFAAMGVPQESVADPDSSWAQINGTVARDLARRLEVRDVRQRPRGAAGAHGNGGGGCAPEGVGSPCRSVRHAECIVGECSGAIQSTDVVHRAAAALFA